MSGPGMPGLRAQLAVLGSGFESAGVVMGAGVYQVYQPFSCVGPGLSSANPYPAYEAALAGAWSDVLLRIEDDARRVSAHGVVGVYLIEQRPTPGSSMMELQLVGTAVRATGAPPLARPFLSMLSMDETMRLLLRGWAPSGIVVGVSAVHVHGWNANPWVQGVTFKNAEMDGPTWGMQEARRRAEWSARHSLAAGRAEGVVASAVEIRRVQQAASNGEGLLIEGRILGTGVVRFRAPLAPLTLARDLAKGAAR